MYKHLIVRITKRHNSCSTDHTASMFLSHMQCLMVKVWCKFDWYRTKAIDVTEQKPYVDGITDMLKTVYPTKTTFCGGYNKCCGLGHAMWEYPYPDLKESGRTGMWWGSRFHWTIRGKNQRTCGPVNAHRTPNPGIYFNAFIHVYIAPGQGQTTPWGQMLMSTESPYQLAHLLQVLKQSLWSMILNTF